jgi:lipid A 4'-phosphatase
VLLAAATLVFRYTDLDLTIVRQFYSGDSSSGKPGIPFPLKDVQPWKWFYNWGFYPAWILGGGGLIVWIASFCWARLKSWRDPGLFLGLLLILGPGMLVNWVFKPCMSRPRPRATIPFGGTQEFLPVLHVSSGEGDFSFPSGHAATGFYLMAPAFICYRRWPKTAVAFLAFGLTAGTVIGLARIVAGDHFPSDVLWAGGIVYFTALALASLFRFGQVSAPPSQEASG